MSHQKQVKKNFFILIVMIFCLQVMPLIGATQGVTNEIQKEADIEFYEETEKKPDPVPSQSTSTKVTTSKPKSKINSNRYLPKTNEKPDNGYFIMGMISLIMVRVFLKKRGEVNETY